MREKKNDRRWQRTRQLLSGALLALMLEKPYEAITVQAIIDRANVGRSTFYAHYRDKDDLLAAEFAHLVEALRQDMSQGAGSRHGIIPSLELFRHVQSRQQLYRALGKGRIWGHSLEFVALSIQQLLSAAVEEQLSLLVEAGAKPAVPLSLAAGAVTASFLAVLEWWLEHGLALTPEQINLQFEQLVLPGVRQALALTGARPAGDPPVAGHGS